MKGWYKAAVDHVPPTARVTLEQITEKRVALYHQVPPPGENIPISVETLQVENLENTEEEIEWEVMRLSTNCSGGLSRMRAEHLWGWLREGLEGRGRSGGGDVRRDRGRDGSRDGDVGRGGVGDGGDRGGDGGGDRGDRDNVDGDNIAVALE